jgi:hypothetical protein
MNKKTTLMLGDILAIAILTVIGFATHDEFDLSYLSRMGTTFFPMLIGWFLAATWVDLFDERVISNHNYFGVFTCHGLPHCLRSFYPNSRAAVLPSLTLILAVPMRWVCWFWRGVFFL